jgi:hypothetical protein
MSIVNSLVTQIDALSSEVESNLQSEDLERCPELLDKRQLLLEKLAATIDDTDMKAFVQYQEFLLSIKARDNTSRDAIIKQQTLLLSQSDQQSKTKKAINAYNKFSD